MPATPHMIIVDVALNAKAVEKIRAQMVDLLAEAWDEGYLDCAHRLGRTQQLIGTSVPNPYRANGGE